MSHPGTLVLIMAVAVLAPLLAYGLGRWIRVPLVILEIVLGVLIGPDVLGWVHEEQVIDTLADLGLCMLIFLAGYEIEFATYAVTRCGARCGPGWSRWRWGSAWRSPSAAPTSTRASSSVPH